jgi:hypothetical protein
MKCKCTEDWGKPEPTCSDFKQCHVAPENLKKIEEAIGELGAAINQSSPSDDKIIMDHVRAAHRLLLSLQPTN